MLRRLLTALLQAGITPNFCGKVLVEALLFVIAAAAFTYWLLVLLWQH